MRSRTRPCPEPGCPLLIHSGEHDCANQHRAAQRRATQARVDAQRPTPRQRGYGTPHSRSFRAPVLRRDPICVLCHQAPSVHADHHPRTRRQLEAAGLNPNDPQYGRGLCHSCHSRETARHDGGFGNPQPAA